jgi:glycosyltransferase involved in cell wall biosynthesis
MSRIVIDGRWLKASGIGRYVENLATLAIQLDTKNEYIMLVPPGASGSLAVPKNRVQYVETDIMWYTPQEQIALPKLLDSLKPDLVHFLNFNVPLTYRKPFVVTVHDLTMLRFKNIRGGLIAPFTYRLKDVVMRHVLKTAIKRSQVVFTPSQFVADDIAKQYRVEPSKLIVTYNAADTLVKQGKVNLKKHKIRAPYLLSVGNMYPNKNIERLIRAMKLLADDPSFKHQLVLVGKADAFSERLKKLAHKLKLDDRVIFTGFVEDAELVGLYNGATAFVFPSLSEGFGIPGLEAMEYGVPVVSSNATCLPEVYGDAALYFDPSKKEDIARAIRELINDPALQERLRKLGAAQAKKYNWKEPAMKMLAGYKKALSTSK